MRVCHGAHVQPLTALAAHALYLPGFCAQPCRRVAHQSPPDAPPSLGMCPLCMPIWGGRSARCMAATHAYDDPASRMESTREALTAPLHAPRGAPRDRTNPRRVRHEREVRAGRGRAARMARGDHPHPRGPRAGHVLVRHDREPRGASGVHMVTQLTPPIARTARARGARREGLEPPRGPWRPTAPSGHSWVSAWRASGTRTVE